MAAEQDPELLKRVASLTEEVRLPGSALRWRVLCGGLTLRVLR
jgi:hypothetical protein